MRKVARYLVVVRSRDLQDDGGGEKSWSWGSKKMAHAEVSIQLLSALLSCPS